jgi:hypothetical protein
MESSRGLSLLRKGMASQKFSSTMFATALSCFAFAASATIAFNRDKGIPGFAQDCTWPTSRSEAWSWIAELPSSWIAENGGRPNLTIT